MLEITSAEQFFDVIADAEGTIVADFMAEWCPPCQRFMKIADRVEQAIAPGGSLVKIDTEKVAELKEIYQVKKIPTFLIFREGRELCRHEGIPTIAELQALIEDAT